VKSSLSVAAFATDDGKTYLGGYNPHFPATAHDNGAFSELEVYPFDSVKHPGRLPQSRFALACEGIKNVEQ
jgi:hypothetical protein